MIVRVAKKRGMWDIACSGQRGGCLRNAFNAHTGALSGAFARAQTRR